MAEAPRDADRILKGLTKAQAEAVSHEAGPLLIIAGPGERSGPQVSGLLG